METERRKIEKFIFTNKTWNRFKEYRVVLIILKEVAKKCIQIIIFSWVVIIPYCAGV
jgi:hypothetical protein